MKEIIAQMIYDGWDEQSANEMSKYLDLAHQKGKKESDDYWYPIVEGLNETVNHVAS